MDDGAPIHVVRHGNLSRPRVVLSQGNAFASDSYFPFWQLIMERFDLPLFDFRSWVRWKKGLPRRTVLELQQLSPESLARSLNSINHLIDRLRVALGKCRCESRDEVLLVLGLDSDKLKDDVLEGTHLGGEIHE